MIKYLDFKQTINHTSSIINKIKAGSNSYKLKHEIRQTLHILYQRNKIAKKVYSNLIKLL